VRGGGARLLGANRSRHCLHMQAHPAAMKPAAGPRNGMTEVCSENAARRSEVATVSDELSTLSEDDATLEGGLAERVAHCLAMGEAGADWQLIGKGIGNGGAAIARVLASNHTVEWVCVQHRVPAWWQPCGTHAHR